MIKNFFLRDDKNLSPLTIINAKIQFMNTAHILFSFYEDIEYLSMYVRR